MAQFGFVLPTPRDAKLLHDIKERAQVKGLSAQAAWMFVVDQILTGMMDERDYASLNEIVAVALARPVRLPETCLSFQELAKGEDAAYPVLRFLSDSVECVDDPHRVIMTRELASTIAQSLSLVLRNDTIQIMVD